MHPTLSDLREILHGTPSSVSLNATAQGGKEAHEPEIRAGPGFNAQSDSPIAPLTDLKDLLAQLRVVGESLIGKT